jgi:hypothetical protein
MSELVIGRTSFKHETDRPAFALASVWSLQRILPLLVIWSA